MKPRVAAHIIARELDQFGADLLGSCLDSLEGYADQVVLVDNGLGREAAEVVRERVDRLPIRVVDGTDVRADFSELRNRAIAETAGDITHIHKIDSDEVYLPESLRQLKEVLGDPSLTRVDASFIHFMIEPTLVESVQRKEVVFRKTDSLTWEGSVHESVPTDSSDRVFQGPGCFLHFGYCRPQWQTFLKWLRYADLQGGGLSHYKYQFVDGVRLSWFQGDMTPDTVLEPRRHRLKGFVGSYPPSTKTWLEQYAQSRKVWREWIQERSDVAFWCEWMDLRARRGSWAETVDEVLSRWLERDLGTKAEP